MHDDPQTFITAVLGAIAGLVLAVSALIGAWARLQSADRHTDKRVDMLWSAHMRMGKREAENREMIVETPEKGPDDMGFTLRADVRAAYQPISMALKSLYRDVFKTGAAENEIALTEALEAKFGPWLSKHICGPLNLKEYACLEMAKLVAMEDDPKPPSWTKPAGNRPQENPQPPNPPRPVNGGQPPLPHD